MRRTRRILLLVLLVAATAAPSALAADRTGYSPVTGSGSPPSASPPSGTLPYTGFDMVPVAIVGAALLTLGFTLHRLARR